MAELHRGPEQAARRRHDAQLHVLATAHGDELRDQPLVDRLRREDHPPDAARPGPILAEEVGRQRPVLADDGGVNFREELELAPDRVRETIAADDHDLLTRRDVPPDRAGEAAQEERSGEGDADDADRRGRAGVGDRRDVEEQNERGHAGDRPHEKLRQLVDRQVPKGAVIAVVEAVDLRGQDPRRQEDQRLGRRRDACAEDRQRRGRRDRGPDVGECEHPAPQGVARSPGLPCAARGLRDVGARNRCLFGMHLISIDREPGSLIGPRRPERQIRLSRFLRMRRKAG